MVFKQKRRGTISAIVGSEKNGLRRLMFTNGTSNFINNPIGVKQLIDLAGVGKPDELVGVTVKFAVLKYGVIETGSMRVI